MANELSKKDYLKRYLESDKDPERKRKKKSKAVKPKPNIPRLKIVDEDIDLKSINFGDTVEEDVDDEAPIVAEIIDDRPVDEKLKELYESSRWKKLNSNETSHSNSMLDSENRNSKYNLEFSKQQLSPNRNYSIKSKDMNCSRTRHDSDSDMSIPRSQEQFGHKQQNIDNVSSKRNRKRYSDSDHSPPPSHKRRGNSRHDSDSDISPPRHNIVNKSNPQSSKSRKHNSDNDISPPRHKITNQPVKFFKQDSSSDISPPRHRLSNKSNQSNKSLRHDSDSDISPPRHKIFKKSDRQLKGKSWRCNSDSDISPPHHGSASKSERKNSRYRHESNSDAALSSSKLSCSKDRSKSQKNSDSDMSPPRSSSKLSAAKDKKKKLDKTMLGLKAGLQNSESLQEEVKELRIREKKQLSMLDDEISGRNAETIIRDRKTGMKRDLNKEKEDETEKNKKSKEYEQKYNKWGKGIEQTQDKIEKFQEEMYEMSKPLARYRDDEDLDERLKNVIHDDDPMAEYIKKRQRNNAPSVPIYSGPPAPPNRFGINPGYRWDGVDRSNGFEKKYFEKINTTKAIQNEAYLWSVQDM